MIKIKTTKGSIEIRNTDPTILKKLQNILTFGVLPFKQTFNGADFGIVMQCGEQEVYCLKQQPLEIEREQAEQLFQLQHIMIIDAYCRYIKMEFSGALRWPNFHGQRIPINSQNLWKQNLSNQVVASTILSSKKKLSE